MATVRSPLTRIINQPRHSPILGLILLTVALSLAACGDPAGTACEISGSGFHASHNCQHKCLQYRHISCPSGDTLQPKVCSGKSSCQPGSCPAGQACYSIDDPFDEESYCVPVDVCGGMDADILSKWEVESKAHAAETRRAWAERFNQNPGQTTEPASDHQQPPDE